MKRKISGVLLWLVRLRSQNLSEATPYNNHKKVHYWQFRHHTLEYIMNIFLSYIAAGAGVTLGYYAVKEIVTQLPDYIAAAKAKLPAKS